MADKEIIEISSAKERFMGNWKMFSKFLYRFPDDTLFGKLKEAIDAGDVSGAFEVAHTMKGVTANLSLKLIGVPLFNMVETLRNGQLPKEKEFDELADAYNLTIKEIERLKENDTSLF